MHWWWIPTYTASLLFFHSGSAHTTLRFIFYIWILKYVRGVVFFHSRSTHSHEYFAASDAECADELFFSCYPHNVHIAYGATIHIFFSLEILRQVLSFRSLIKFTQPFYNSHYGKKLFEDFPFEIFFQLLIDTGWCDFFFVARSENVGLELIISGFCICLTHYDGDN